MLLLLVMSTFVVASLSLLLVSLLDEVLADVKLLKTPVAIDGVQLRFNVPDCVTDCDDADLSSYNRVLIRSRRDVKSFK